MPYYSENFSTPGYFNGFPFILSKRENWMNTSGIKEDEYISASHYWNLAKLSAKFKIKTTDAPSSYSTGYAYKEGYSPIDGETVEVEYEVINSVDEGIYPPKMRMAHEITGVSETQSLNSSTNLIQGSGENYTSCYVTDEPNFSIPMTIQPSNTGAFVITSDSGVASHFEGLSDFGPKSNFQMELKMDFGSGQYPADTDTQAISQTWYIVPALDWAFAVTTGELIGGYYSYPDEPIKD